MTLLCTLKPRPDASSDELKALGSAVYRWAKQELRESGMIESIDASGLADLLRGELPQPLALRIATSHKKIGEGLDIDRLLIDLGPEASDRSLSFSLREERFPKREGLIERLREAMPAEFIEDVLIEGESWDQVEE